MHSPIDPAESFTDWATRNRIDTNGPFDAEWISQWLAASNLMMVNASSVNVCVTVTSPSFDNTRVLVGTHPRDLLPLSREQKTEYVALAYSQVGHKKLAHDGWTAYLTVSAE